MSGEREVDDVLTYALFPQIGLKFLQNRDNADAFEPVPTGKDVPTSDDGEEIYTVNVEGVDYTVTVNAGGDITGIVPPEASASAPAAAGPAPTSGEPVPAPLAGNIFKVHVKPGDSVQEGDLIVILEAMKMETEVRAPRAGQVVSVDVKEGDSVVVGASLMQIG